MEYDIEIVKYTDEMYDKYANEDLLLPLICECFSINDKIYKFIDDLYKPIRYECYKLAKESKWYDHKIAKEGSLLNEEYFKKILGLFLYNAKNTDELSEFLLNIIKQGWHYSWTYVEQRNTINMDDFMVKLNKKFNGFDNISDDELNSHIYIMYFLSTITNKILIECKWLSFIKNGIVERMRHYNDMDNTRFDYKNKATNSERKCVKELCNKLKKEYGINNGLTYKAKIENIELYHYYTDLVYDVEDIMLGSVVGDNKLNQHEFEELVYIYLIYYVESNRLNRNAIDLSLFDYDDFQKYIILMTQLRYSLKTYKQVKEHYFENNKETMFAEVEEKDKEIKDIKKDKLLLQDDNVKLSNRIEELERENKRLQLELNKANNNKNELIGLREFVFRLDNEDIPLNDSEIDLEKINTINGVIIGGHINWVNKLSYKVKWTYISVDNSGFDVKGLLNKDIIVINTQYLNHGMYYRIMSAIEGKDIRIEYINSTNIDNAVRDIWNMVKGIE